MGGGRCGVQLQGRLDAAVGGGGVGGELRKALMVFQYHSKAFDVGLGNSVNGDVVRGALLEMSIKRIAGCHHHLRGARKFDVGKVVYMLSI